MEIDDDWTPAYGDMDFDTKKFPDAKAMVQALEEKGFRVTVWVRSIILKRSTGNAAVLSLWLGKC